MKTVIIIIGNVVPVLLLKINFWQHFQNIYSEPIPSSFYTFRCVLKWTQAILFERFIVKWYQRNLSAQTHFIKIQQNCVLYPLMKEVLEMKRSEEVCNKFGHWPSDEGFIRVLKKESSSPTAIHSGRICAVSLSIRKTGVL